MIKTNGETIVIKLIIINLTFISIYIEIILIFKIQYYLWFFFAQLSNINKEFKKIRCNKQSVVLKISTIPGVLGNLQKFNNIFFQSM